MYVSMLKSPGQNGLEAQGIQNGKVMNLMLCNNRMQIFINAQKQGR